MPRFNGTLLCEPGIQAGRMATVIERIDA